MLYLLKKFYSYRTQNRLSYRLLVSILMCSTLLAVLSTAVQLFWDYKNDVASIEKGIDTIRAGYLDSLASSLWKLDKEQIAIQLDGIMKLPDIEYASITEIVAGKEEAAFFRGSEHEDYPIFHEFSLHYKDTLVGRLKVGATLERVYQRLIGKSLVILGSQAIKTFLVSIAILFIVHFLIVRHLNTMSSFARRFDLENLDADLVLEGPRKKGKEADSLDYLADTLNNMCSNIGKQLRDKKRAQDQLQELNEELEQRVKYRTATLRHTNEKLSETLEALTDAQDKLVETEKMAALGELVAGVAHEINTPIGNSITSATYLKEVVDELGGLVAEDKLTRQGLEDARQTIVEASGLIYTNLSRASELVSSFKQIAVDQANEVAQRFNVSKNLQQILVSLKHNLKQSGCEVVVECDERLEIFSYPGSFVRIYTNLIMNSLIHGFEGMEKGQVHIQIRQQGSKLEIRYRDDGRGIPEAIRHKIFDPFVTSKRGHGGSGLGTHIVYNLVTRLLNGSIRCESERGQGALFEILLPLQPLGSSTTEVDAWD